ncbi:hypothetical protein DEDE109153_15525 [Deinococcus deserti]
MVEIEILSWEILRTLNRDSRELFYSGVRLSHERYSS